MKAIICAAGRGVRLGASSPKILLEFGGRTLLEWHVLRLREVGVDDVILVTGHLREQVATVLPAIYARHGLRIRELVNERFHEGSVLSLAAALPEFEGNREPILLMDADVLYPRGCCRSGCFAPAKGNNVAPGSELFHRATMIPCSCR